MLVVSNDRCFGFQRAEKLWRFYCCSAWSMSAGAVHRRLWTSLCSCRDVVLRAVLGQHDRAWGCSSWTRLSSCPLREDSARVQTCRKPFPQWQFSTRWPMSLLSVLGGAAGTVLAFVDVPVTMQRRCCLANSRGASDSVRRQSQWTFLLCNRDGLSVQLWRLWRR